MSRNAIQINGFGRLISAFKVSSAYIFFSFTNALVHGFILMEIV